MPLSSPATIAGQIDSDIQAIGVTAGTPITPTQRKAIWTAVVTRIYADIQANLGVEPGSFVVVGVTPGGATVPVTGVGGPGE